MTSCDSKIWMPIYPVGTYSQDSRHASSEGMSVAETLMQAGFAVRIEHADGNMIVLRSLCCQIDGTVKTVGPNKTIRELLALIASPTNQVLWAGAYL